MIMNPIGKLQVDHINGDRLDNRRCNLRVATYQQNSMNQHRTAISSSVYKGVSYRKDTNKFTAYITVNYKKINLGCFRSEQDAALAYDNAARVYFGEFANLNFKV